VYQRNESMPYASERGEPFAFACCVVALRYRKRLLTQDVRHGTLDVLNVVNCRIVRMNEAAEEARMFL
jgi:hypothetical protein